MKMKSKISKLLVGGIFCLGSIGSTVMQASAYSSIYFDSSLDTRNNQVVVNFRSESHDKELRGEDEYVTEGLFGNRSTESGSKWSNKFEPSKETGVYEAKNANIFEKWTRNVTSFVKDTTITSKKLTVPAMKLKQVGKETSVSNVSEDSDLAITLRDAVMDVDRKNNTNLSMVNGLNQILAKIETLKGGYEDDEDFKNTLMALGHLFSGKAKDNKVIIGVNTEGESVDKKDSEKNDEPKVTDPKDPDYEGNGKNIIVTMGSGGVVRRVTIAQEGAENQFVWNETMLIKAHTDYKMVGGYKESPYVGDLSITYQPKGKAPKQYVNAQYVSWTISADDIEFIKLTDIIAHALIKYENGVTSISAGGQMSTLEKLVYGLVNTLLDGVETGLGLVPIEDLIYNAAIIDEYNSSRANYVMGLYPKEWESLITIVYSFMGLLSVSVLVFSVLRVFYRMTLDSMNVGKRVELKEDIAAILQTIAIMFIFRLLFILIAKINYVFVSTVYEGLGGGSIVLNSADVLGSSMVGNIIRRAILLVVNVYLNVVYVIRALNVSLLLALAPAFITAVAFGKKELFAQYIKEILGNIFLQSFHALIFLFIFEAQSYLAPGVDASASFTSTFTSVVLTFAAVPTTRMFKLICMPSTLMKVGEDVGNKFSNKAKQTGMRTMKTAGKAAAGTAAAGAANVAGAAMGGIPQLKKIGEAKEKATDAVNNIKDLSKMENGEALFKDISEKTRNFTNEEAMINVMEGLTADQKKDLGDYVSTAEKISNAGKDVLEKGMSSSNMKDHMRYATTKGNPLKKGQEWKQMREGQKKMKETMESFNTTHEKTDFSKVNDFMNKDKGGGVYGYNGDEGYSLTQDFAKNVGFDSIGIADRSNSEGSDFGHAFELRGNTAENIDKMKIPPKAEREKMEPERQNFYNAVECVQNARKEIKAYQKDLSFARKEKNNDKIAEIEGSIKSTVDRTKNELDGYGVTQKGLVGPDIRSGGPVSMTVKVGANREVMGSVGEGRVSIVNRPSN